MSQNGQGRRGSLVATDAAGFIVLRIVLVELGQGRRRHVVPAVLAAFGDGRWCFDRVRHGVDVPAETPQGKRNDQQQDEAKAGTHGGSLEGVPS